LARILVVEDEEPIRELLRFNLSREGHQVEEAADGLAALAAAQTQPPDLIILDVMLPGQDGLAVCRQLRAQEATTHIPVIMLTARAEELDKVLGLEMGADDYVTKPFSPRELAARVKACLRRHTAPAVPPAEVELHAGPLVLQPDCHQAWLRGEALDLTPKEFELLKTLMENRGRVLKRDVLLDRVWGYDQALDTRTVDVHIRYLRQKIEADPANPQLIETVRGVGYRFRGGQP